VTGSHMLCILQRVDFLGLVKAFMAGYMVSLMQV
jgi:hypothetical protein